MMGGLFVQVIVCPAKLESKSITCPLPPAALRSSIACRNDPEPLSPALFTVNVEAVAEDNRARLISNTGSVFMPGVLADAV